MKTSIQIIQGLSIEIAYDRDVIVDAIATAICAVTQAAATAITNKVLDDCETVVEWGRQARQAINKGAVSAHRQISATATEAAEATQAKVAEVTEEIIDMATAAATETAERAKQAVDQVVTQPIQRFVAGRWQAHSQALDRLRTRVQRYTAPAHKVVAIPVLAMAIEAKESVQ